MPNINSLFFFDFDETIISFFRFLEEFSLNLDKGFHEIQEFVFCTFTLLTASFG